MSWEVVYKIQGGGTIGQSVANETAANTKIQDAINSQSPYLDIDGVKIRRESIVVIQKRNKNSP